MCSTSMKEPGFVPVKLHLLRQAASLTRSHPRLAALLVSRLQFGEGQAWASALVFPLPSLLFSLSSSPWKDVIMVHHVHRSASINGKPAAMHSNPESAR